MEHTVYMTLKEILSKKRQLPKESKSGGGSFAQATVWEWTLKYTIQYTATLNVKTPDALQHNGGDF